jgi:catechol 2,3-dioxygenase-like lactoylglutathione lyase family enzyme
MEACLAFYRKLGLELVVEKHGQGPVHYSCSLENLVLEIYPGSAGLAPEPKVGGATMIGFSVNSLHDTLTALQDLSVKVLSPPMTALWGLRTVVLDPDGRAVELIERDRE